MIGHCACWCSLSCICGCVREWEHKGGKYLAECEVAPLGEDDHKAESFGHVPHTYDPEREARLWRDSLKMVGLEDN